MADPIRVTAQPVEEIEADLVVIGPEAPLVDGLADRLRADGRAVMGPGADGARLEGSKAFMKEMLEEAGVPTARFAAFGAAEQAEALAYLEQLPGPWVVKTDGLAAGKGVLVARTIEEARADVTAKLSGEAFGDAGERIVIEEGLEGEECSLLVLFDGTTAVPLLPAQDFKRVGDDDRGPIPAAWAPMPRCRTFRRRGRRHYGDGRRTAHRHPAQAGHRLSRRALRRADARRGRTEGH